MGCRWQTFTVVEVSMAKSVAIGRLEDKKGVWAGESLGSSVTRLSMH